MIMGLYINSNMNNLKSILDDTEFIFDCEKTIHMLFEEQAEKMDSKIAIVYQSKRISYKELNKKANQVARVLISSGVTPNTVVALMVNRSIDMIIGILGILKAGGCYLPIDPLYPKDRIKFMLEDSCAKIILTHKQIVKKEDFNGIIINLDENYIYNCDSSNIKSMSTASDLAYVIYTSGSTGKPKGVMIEHKAVHNFIKGVTNVINFSSKKSIVCLTTISFDIFVLETLLPLSMGIKIVIANPMQLSTDLGDENVDMLQTTPSTMKLILNDEKNIKYIRQLSDIMLGGEAFTRQILVKLKSYTNARIYNMYGPTETTVWSTIKDLTYSEEITIGKPISNTQIYIIDSENSPVNYGEIGEICIAGDGLARGYLNRVELTKERFVDCPAMKEKKMYKTGDLAKMLPSGDIEYHGRIDLQVKIRGFRIELGEIEDCLKKYKAIKECVVGVKVNKLGEKYLVAYYISENELIISDIISFLSKSLPEYMIPGFYIRIPSIPLTPNGKIDRNSLPNIDSSRPKLMTRYVVPNTVLENKIASIWRKILNRDSIGINDNFFELGGNSLLISQMFVQLEKYYPERLNIADAFAYPTIYKLVKFIEGNKFDVDNNSRIPFIKFPNDFYIKDCNSFKEGIFEAKIDNNLYVDLKVFAKKNMLELKCILLAVFIIILSEMSKEKKVGILLGINDASFYKCISLDLQNVISFEDVCNYVNIELQNDNSEIATFDRLNRNISEEQMNILPTCYLNCTNTNTDNTNELGLLIQSYDRNLTIRIMYNSSKLVGTKIKNLFKNYLNLLKIITIEK